MKKAVIRRSRARGRARLGELEKGDIAHMKMPAVTMWRRGFRPKSASDPIESAATRAGKLAPTCPRRRMKSPSEWRDDQPRPPGYISIVAPAMAGPEKTAA